MDQTYLENRISEGTAEEARKTPGLDRQGERIL